jgi:hypothetical protein
LFEHTESPERAEPSAFFHARLTAGKIIGCRAPFAPRTIFRGICDWFAPTLPRAPLAKAFDFAVRHWQALIRYTENGVLLPDNNALVFCPRNNFT